MLVSFLWPGGVEVRRTISQTNTEAVSFLHYTEREISNSEFQKIIKNISEVFDIFDMGKKDFFVIKHKFKDSILSFNSDPTSIIFLAKSNNETLEININKIEL